MLQKLIKFGKGCDLEIFLLILLFFLLLIWNIPHTIAAKYMCEYLSLLIIVHFKPPWIFLIKQNKILLLFFLYLIAQLFIFSENYDIAFKNFYSEWMHFILFSLIGLGAGSILVKKYSEDCLLYFGIASLIPLAVYLSLSLIKGLEIGNIPWNYIRVYENRGTIGYTALQTILFLCPILFSTKNSIVRKNLVMFALLICVASTLVAYSRGGLIFGIGSIVFILIAGFLTEYRKIKLNRKLILSVSILGFLIFLIVYLISNSVNSDRWTSMFDRAVFATKGNPIEIFCDGTDSFSKTIKFDGQEITQETQDKIASINNGDGARIMALRAGLKLTLLHPWGIDQSRQAFQIALIKRCAENPKILIAHSHNGWLNTSLALGIPGAVLLLLVFFKYTGFGFQRLKKNKGIDSIFALARFSSASIYFIRGLFDATLQDQMLEMQAFIFAFLMGGLLTIEEGDT